MGRLASIIQDEKECYVCHTTQNLNVHHIFFGTANRRISDRVGFWCYLCVEHHTGNTGVHFNKKLNLELRQITQRKYEEMHSREDFMRLTGRNYL